MRLCVSATVSPHHTPFTYFQILFSHREPCAQTVAMATQEKLSEARGYWFICWQQRHCLFCLEAFQLIWQVTFLFSWKNIKQMHKEHGARKSGTAARICFQKRKCPYRGNNKPIVLCHIPNSQLKCSVHLKLFCFFNWCNVQHTGISEATVNPPYSPNWTSTDLNNPR